MFQLYRQFYLQSRITCWKLKCLKAMNYLLYNLRKYPYNRKVCQLFDSFVNPVLSYACEIWGFSKSKEIERIHFKFLKNILNVKTNTLAHLYMVNWKGILCTYVDI